MTKSMLIDAQHEDETRVVIIDGDRIDDFDFVTAAKTQLKGNIYLAKITRVEPSLQAAFVEYGGGKQGFLPFSEIHPDYYQIPIEDKKRLIEEEEEESLREEEEEEQELENRDRRPRRGGRNRRRGRGRDRRPREDGQEHADGWQVESSDEHAGNHAHAHDDHHHDTSEHAPSVDEEDVFDDGDSDNTEYKASEATRYAVASEPVADDEHTPDAAPTTDDESADAAAAQSDETEETAAGTAGRTRRDSDEEGDEEEEDRAETVSDDDMEETRRRRKGSSFKRYRIQEVIKRNQIVLVQVIKEERGNKGVSLTTYISLAGRYCVLMPNSPKAGGVSRKIANGEQRKKLKEIVASLKESRGLAAIIRTAGIDRTKTEIKRDYEYLAKLWSQIRDDTLASTAPALIYEESNVIKRSIRDLYASDVEQILVQGEQAYKEAKSFMRMIMPSHAARIKLHKESQPIFSAYGVEEQLATMYEPSARLPSGGSIVLQQTEALISIDVNSGRSTTERNVEETAIKTNLEAAKEVARQLRLRDLAGLIVIDFIDMNYGKNRRNLERAMKEALKVDRAKIQMSRISPFGLMELSRQRLRPSIAESSTQTCPHCEGTGSIRSVETVAIQIIRLLEREASGGEYRTLKVYTYPEVALHLLNERRSLVQRLEQEYNVSILILIDSNILVSKFRLIKVGEDGKEQVHRDELQDSRRRNRRGRRGGRNRERDRSDRPSHESRDRDDSDEDSQEDRHSRHHHRRDRFESDEDDNDDDTIETDEDDADDQPYARSNRRPPVDDSDASDADSDNEGDEDGHSSDRPRNRDRGERGDRDRGGRRGRRGGRNRNRNRDRNRDRGERTDREDRGNREDGNRNDEDHPRETRQQSDQADEAPQREDSERDRPNRDRPQRATVKPEPAPETTPVIRDYTPPPAVILEDPSDGAEPKQKRRGWWSKTDA